MFRRRGFLTPVLRTRARGRASAYQYDPTGSAWSFSAGAGLAGNGSGFTSGNPNAPQGSQVAFLQASAATISQAVNFPTASSYVISLSAAQRGNYGTSNEEVQVLVDGTVVDTFTPASTSYATYTTPSFYVTAGSHTISFVGVDPTGADYTALLDQVSIYAAPTQIGFSDPGFEIPSQGTGRRPSSMNRRARHGASAPGPAWRATAAASPPATPTPRRAPRSPSCRGTAPRSARR